MEASIHRFVRLLRHSGLRISVSESLDAMRCAGQPGVLADRETLRAALRVALIKERRDEEVFDEIFDSFFGLVKIEPGSGGEPHSHGHDALSDTGNPDSFTLSEQPGETPQQGHEHDSPADIRDYFDPADLAQQYNLHQEANKIDLAAMTDEIVFSKDNRLTGAAGQRIQLEAGRLHGAGLPGVLSRITGTAVDADLTIAEQDALLGWLNAAEETASDGSLAGSQQKLTGMLTGLPEALKRHLEALLALEQRAMESRERRVATVEQAGERERAELEQALRQLAHSFRGALSPRATVAAQGRIDSRRTMRRNQRYDGIPFMPVTVRRAQDKPRLVVLVDFSLSVRTTARFTLHLVHDLQSMFSQVRSFAFVAETTEISELFMEHGPERALGLIFGGDVLDVDANSDYGLAFGQFLAEYASCVTSRTTLLILGDGRGNGNDPNLPAFEEISRKARETIWLTPEPRYSWRLGACDLPAYGEYCDRIQVVRDLSGVERLARELVVPGRRR